MKVTRIGAAGGLLVMGMLVGGEALGQSKCRALRYKFAGKAAFQKAKCYLKASKKGLDVDPACIALADEVMFKKLEKADLKVDCPSGDVAAISVEVNSFVDGLRLTLGEPTAPACGNDSHESGEACDGTDDANCPGLCQADCTCAPGPGSCGNNTQEAGEACDGSDDTACPALCQSDCTCFEPSGVCPCFDAQDLADSGEYCVFEVVAYDPLPLGVVRLSLPSQSFKAGFDPSIEYCYSPATGQLTISVAELVACDEILTSVLGDCLLCGPGVGGTDCAAGYSCEPSGLELDVGVCVEQ